MSNHSSQKRILLHHTQIEMAKQRKIKRAQERWAKYRIRSAEFYAMYTARLGQITEVMSLSWYAILLGIILTGGWLIL